MLVRLASTGAAHRPRRCSARSCGCNWRPFSPSATTAPAGACPFMRSTFWTPLGHFPGRDGLYGPSTGSPEAVTRLRLPQNVACGFPALRSSEIDSQHSKWLQVPVGKPQLGLL